MKKNIPLTNHRQRLESCLAGKKLDRPPVALWRHFPVDDQDPATLAAAVLDYQNQWDFDLVKVTPASSFCLKDWGSQDEWRGNPEGTRDYTRGVIQTPEDWMRLRPISPSAPHLAAQLECLRQLMGKLGPEIPVIQTIFNPLSQAKNLVGKNNLIVHLRRCPEAVHAGLKVIAESTQRFVEAAQQMGIAGVFFAVQHAQVGLLTEAEYAEFGRPYDLQALEPARMLWLNMLHLHGEHVMFDAFLDYPVTVINWHDRDTAPSLADALKKFDGAVCGGLRRENVVLGTPESVRAEARNAIQATDGKRFILGTGCVTPITAPRANLMAVRQSVER